MVQPSSKRLVTEATGDTRYNKHGSAYINVADYATPYLAMAALTTGATIIFPPAVYALGSTSLAAPSGVDKVTVSAAGAAFTVSAWGVPAFDLLGVNGWTLDIGLVQYVGTRGTSAGSLIRGQAPYTLGSGVYTNGDRHFIRKLRTIGMPTPINFSSWDGTTAVGHYGQSNRVGYLECEGYDFGVLWIGQNDFTIDQIYAHDDIDDSSGGNPTHAYYCTATSAFRSTGVKIGRVRAQNNLFGQAFQLKNCDQAQLGPHSADNCRGLINVIDSHDLSWTDMKGTNILDPGSGAAAITLQTLVSDSQRPQLTNTKLVMAANQDGVVVKIQASEAQVDGISVVSNHSASVNTGFSDIWLRGVNGRLRGATLKSVGAEHCGGILILNAPASTGWKIDKPIVNLQRWTVSVQAGCTGTAIDYDPAAQILTGAGSAVTGATTDYYLVGAVPTMGQVNASALLTLTGTPTDIVGATATITPSVAGKLFVHGTFDFSVGTAGEMLGGSLNVDGTNQTAQVLLAGSVSRATISRSWTVSLTSGSHTIKLQANRVTGTGATHSINQTHTGFSYQFVPSAA